MRKKDITTTLELGFYELDALVYFLSSNKEGFLSEMKHLDGEYKASDALKIISKLELALEETL